jgi:ribonuclease HI
MILKIYTDGGSKGNPGPSSIGMVFYVADKKVFQHKENIGVATNNDAEYQALIKALEIINPKSQVLNKFQIPNFQNIKQIQFYSDSRLMVNQVNGMFKVKNGKIREYIFKIRILEQEIKIPINYYLISREENWEADELVNSL